MTVATITRVFIALFIMALTGCATPDTRETQDKEQAVRDFIDVRGLEALDRMPRSDRDSWKVLEDHFLIYYSRRGDYLVEFARRCHELRDNTTITPDERWDNNWIRARFDTLRGCHIHRIYALSEAEVAELKDIGESPGSRN